MKQAMTEPTNGSNSFSLFTTLGEGFDFFADRNKINYLRRSGSPFEFIWISDSVGDITGFSLSDINVKSNLWHERVHPYDQRSFMEKLQKTSDQSFVSFEYRFQNKSGLYRRFKERVKTFRLPTTAEPVLMGTIEADVEPKRIIGNKSVRLSRSLVETEMARIFQSVAEKISTGILILDASKRITFANWAAEEMLGLQRSHLIGSRAPIELPLTSESVTVKIRGCANSAGWARVSMTKLNHVDGKSLISLTDITLMRENVQLKRYQTLLERAKEESEQFAYVASHDLQAPVRHIRNYVEILHGELSGRLNDVEKEAFEIITKESSRVQLLISGLLEISRFGRESLSKSRVDLRSLFFELKDVLKEELEKNQAELVIADIGSIEADEHKIFQVFQNIILNSLKYRSQSRDPIISVECRETKDKLVISVKDNGIGIEPRHFTKIFQIFQRLHGRNEYSGSGIGLSICKKIIDLHEGKIWVESEQHLGSTFFVELPR